MSGLLIDTSQLADIHVVYRMFDATGRLLYVGMTGELGKRLSSHTDKVWFLAVTTITIERHPGYAEAALAEQEAISTEGPLHNKVGLSKEEVTRRIQVRKLQRTDERLREAYEKRLHAAKEKQRLAEAKRLASEETERLRREQPPRDLMADLSKVVTGDERVRVSALPHLLRQLAPTHLAYESLTGADLLDFLQRNGVRTTNTGNVRRLDPADLRRARDRSIRVTSVTSG
jgi:predicted GIY-YIG superfamily endonuclease